MIGSSDVVAKRTRMQSPSRTGSPIACAVGNAAASPLSFQSMKRTSMYVRLSTWLTFGSPVPPGKRIAW